MTEAAESISFSVLGPPVPKGRPRFCRGVAVTPARTRKYESLVRKVAEWHCGHWRKDGLYRVTLVFTGASPSADLDNLAKAALDGMEGVAFDNDRQVHWLCVMRNTAKSDPRMDVTLERIGDKPEKRKKKAVKS